jgi:hypothetical protein
MGPGAVKGEYAPALINKIQGFCQIIFSAVSMTVGNNNQPLGVFSAVYITFQSVFARLKLDYFAVILAGHIAVCDITIKLGLVFSGEIIIVNDFDGDH